MKEELLGIIEQHLEELRARLRKEALYPLEYGLNDNTDAVEVWDPLWAKGPEDEYETRLAEWRSYMKEKDMKDEGVRVTVVHNINDDSFTAKKEQ